MTTIFGAHCWGITIGILMSAIAVYVGGLVTRSELLIKVGSALALISLFCAIVFTITFD